MPPGMKIVKLEKGHTAQAAEFIQLAVGGDLFEIETVKTYMEDHMKMIYEARDELNQGIRPEQKKQPHNLASAAVSMRSLRFDFFQSKIFQD